MSVLIAHASKDEKGGIKNGQAGDQTGKEVCVRTWYERPWNVLIRFIDVAKANKVADCMEAACANDCIGYDQNQRNTLLREARKYNYDVSKIKTPCEADCSSLVSVACMYAGVPESTLTLNGNCATTRTLRQILKSTGEVEVYTTSPYVAKTDRLRRGDILIKEGSHTAVVVKVDKQLKSVDEIAKEVIAGKWGQGIERRANLTEAGYNYAIIQARVNEILKGKPVDPEKYIWDYLMSKINNPYGVAGLMGNLKAESNLNPKNLQNSCEKRLGMNDEQYTQAVDNGTYKNFTDDRAGYGLAQWTSSGRKKGLLNSRKNRSIGDLDVQLEYLWKELSTSYKKVLNSLKTAQFVRDASDVVLTKFEIPKDQSEKVKQKRATMGMEFFNKYGGKQ